MSRRPAEAVPSPHRAWTYRVLLTCVTCVALASLTLLAIPAGGEPGPADGPPIALEKRPSEPTPELRTTEAVPRLAQAAPPAVETPPPASRETRAPAQDEPAPLRDDVRVLVEAARRAGEGLERIDATESAEGIARQSLDAMVPAMLEIATRHPRLFQDVMSKAFDQDGAQRAAANESAAMATLRNVASAQAQLQASAAIDQDGDGAGEYGFFGELSGGRALRGTAESILTPPVLSAAFRKVEQGIVQRSGYAFRIYLPDAAGQGVFEPPAGETAWAVTGPSAADLGEVVWCAYAWPLERTESNRRAFFVNQNGDVLACSNTVANAGRGYAGADAPPPHAAFLVEGFAGLLTGKVAVNATGWDGETWVVVR